MTKPERLLVNVIGRFTGLPFLHGPGARHSLAVRAMDRPEVRFGDAGTLMVTADQVFAGKEINVVAGHGDGHVRRLRRIQARSDAQDQAENADPETKSRAHRMIPPGCHLVFFSTCGMKRLWSIKGISKEGNPTQRRQARAPAPHGLVSESRRGVQYAHTRLVHHVPVRFGGGPGPILCRGG